MKLKSLWINGYKNLIDSTINFEGDSIPIAIIGNNGTGKSNLIEALLHIFMGLYYDKAPDFEFTIEYVAYGKFVKVSKLKAQQSNTIFVDEVEWSRTRFKRRIRETGSRPPFPSLVFGYYSGTCERVKNQLKRYERTFAAKLKNQSRELERNFVFSDIDQAKWVLLSLIAHKHTELLKKLSVAGAKNLKITVRPPRNYNPNSEDIKFWDTTGATRDFLAALDNYAVDSVEKRHDTGDLFITEERRYDFYLSDFDGEEQLEKVAASLSSKRTNLYSMLQAFAASGMLVNIEYEIKPINRRNNFSFDALSEGEKQLLCVIGGLTMVHHKECLVLLDEPDTHLNPAWSWEYTKLLQESLHSKQLQDSTVFIATHDPVLISGLTRDQVLIAKNENGVLNYDHPHRNPRGQGVANLLTSEFFGLPSSLDLYTQDLIDERLRLGFKDEITDADKQRLRELNAMLSELSLTISERREEEYKEFLRQKYQG